MNQRDINQIKILPIVNYKSDITNKDLEGYLTNMIEDVKLNIPKDKKVSKLTDNQRNK